MQDTITAAARDVLAERERQQMSEGWGYDHDDGHGSGDLARAAACYALPTWCRDTRVMGRQCVEAFWPWSFDWWKPAKTPGGRRRELVKAGALILAEIERLDRAAAKSS